MVNIILCDDDRFILSLATDMVKDTIEKNRIDAKIICVATESSEVFQFLNSNPGTYLVFLDLDFGTGKLNGIDVAKQIKKMNPLSKIVFVTNHQEMAMKVLSSGVEPYGFLEKTTDMQNLRNGYQKYLQMAISSISTNTIADDKLVITVGIDETVTILKGQILYVESEKTISHGISYHTVDGSCLTVRDSMDHVIQLLGENFIRVHRSVIANKKHMISLKGSNIHLSNGEEIPCAIRSRNEVKKWIQ